MRRSFNAEGQFVWDSTSLNLAMECPRKYYYSMIRSIVPQETSVHLIFGGIYAAALEHFYHQIFDHGDFDKALISTVRYALLESWTHELTSSGERILGTGQPVHFDHNAKTRETLIRTIIWYLDTFGHETPDGIQTVRLKNGKPAVELSVMAEINDDFFYAGHIDRLVTYAGNTYWMDQKTTGGSIGARFFDSFKPSNQFYGYTWLGKIVLSEPVYGGIIDAAQIAVGFSRFDRRPMSCTPDQLEEWLDSALWTMYAARQWFMLNRYPHNFTSCDKYGGCPYRELCSRPEAVRERFIESNYKMREKPWDPAVPR